GDVYAYGDAVAAGGATPAQLGSGEKITSLSPTPSGKGYWLFTTKGRVLTFGDAKSFGDLAGKNLNGAVQSSVATASGNGYYMVASDGGVFAFGDAKFRGSMGSTKLNQPVESLVPTGDGGGYWLVASDGGIFAFGNAPFRGSMGAQRLNKPVVGMVRYGDGYLMVAADGGIFAFSGRLGGRGRHQADRRHHPHGRTHQSHLRLDGQGHRRLRPAGQGVVRPRHDPGASAPRCGALRPSHLRHGDNKPLPPLTITG